MMEYRQDYADLRTLLECNAGACGYYEALPAGVRAALRRQERITSAAELQSFAADELEPI